MMIHCPPQLLERIHAHVSSPVSVSLVVVVVAQDWVVLLRVLAEFDADRLIVLTTAPVLDDDEVRLSVLAAESVLAAAPLLVTAPLLAAAPVLGEAAPVGEVVSTCRLRQKKKSC
jgi:hypothetical protein